MSLDDEHTKSLYSSSAPVISPQMQKSFPSVLLKTGCQFCLRMHSKSAQKPAKREKTSRDKISQRTSIATSKKKILEANERRSGIPKGLQLTKIITPPVINHLS